MFLIYGVCVFGAHAGHYADLAGLGAQVQWCGASVRKFMHLGRSVL